MLEKYNNFKDGTNHRWKDWNPWVKKKLKIAPIFEGLPLLSTFLSVCNLINLSQFESGQTC